MNKFLVLIALLFFFVKPAFAQTPITHSQPKEEFFKATVVEIVDQGQKEIHGVKNYFQTLRVKIDDGSEKGKFTVIQNGDQTQITKVQLVSKNQDIVVEKTTLLNDRVAYSIYDFYRLNSLIIFVILFFVAVVIIAGLRGLGSILGMIVSLLVILGYIVPNLLKGSDPLNVTLIGATAIIIITTYLAHGVSKKTSIALVSTLISLFLTAGLAILAIKFASITGLENEDSFTLQLGPTSVIDLKGLFLSAIIIGTLGALNDITLTQSATIYELKKTDSKLKLLKLFEKGFNVGKEHIASLVNTLVLAYVGSAFAVFIFLVLNPSHLPYWVILNNEVVSDEIIKVIAGSMGLLLSVPIATAIASYVFGNEKSSG